jgi:hypothetical protein
VQRLDPTERALWEQSWDGRSLHQVADELGLSYGKAKRTRRRVFAVLQEAVR